MTLLKYFANDRYDPVLIRRLIQGILVISVLVSVSWAALYFLQYAKLVQEQKEIAGALTGAAGTIFVGWLAWIAVWDQIEIAKQPASEALTVAKEALSEIVDILDEFWGAIDWALEEENAERRADRMSHALIMIETWRPPIVNIDNISILAASLSAVKKNRVTTIVDQLRYLYQMIDYAVKAQQRDDRDIVMALKIVRARLTHVENATRSFDHHLAQQFADNRFRIAVDESTISEQMENYIAGAKEEERRREAAGQYR